MWLLDGGGPPFGDLEKMDVLKTIVGHLKTERPYAISEHLNTMITKVQHVKRC
jgi:hypothetical protein